MLAIPATETVNFALLFTWTTNAMSQARIIHSGVQRGGANGATAPGIQRVKLQKLKCC